MTTSHSRGATSAADGQIDRELYERAAYALFWKFESVLERAAVGELRPPQVSGDSASYRACADKLAQHANKVAQHANKVQEAARCSQALARLLRDPHMQLERLEPSLRAQLEQKARELGSAPWGGIPLSAFPDPEDVE
ncbi:hypothetical protein [Rubrivivax benzoatilyticus]|uniref:Uncharacterized protein n=1 Tax=Rubrivivax benzoatilyticus TaxID=316997 RepID=A0ABX0HUK8_9BURK|nr:hypothetical protein [Rubrivivax benzoatilyticus]EGJ11960.1 hypothetical protein RBXJA2T_16597 [Rubrivivax benzoatilyticus JA2 = ATCC BAA-35]NHK97482.1 hypothetical protein [Rubrivivax benzoatilyticus]NHL22823.1 hypothetical protein [Rubrivivax benzoatilyticus]